MEKQKLYSTILWLVLIVCLIWEFMFIAIATVNKGLMTQGILMFCFVYTTYFSVMGLISLLKRFNV